MDAGYPPACPSLPAYLLMTSGTTHGSCDNRSPKSHQIVGDSVFNQVEAAGLEWRGYAESMPTPCAPADSRDGRYVVRHSPAAYYVGLRDRAVGASKVRPDGRCRCPVLGSRAVGEPFGTLADGTAVERYPLRSGDLEVAVLSYGGIVQSVLAPDRRGRRADVVLGFDDAARYEADSPYFGALVGRYANRIAGARFTLDGHSYPLTPNNGPNTLHGGPRGFDKRVWSVEEMPDAGGVRLALTSPNGDQGFPARLSVAVTYRLQGDSLRLDYEATNDEPRGGLSTVVNLTNHTYWNLAGEGSGSVGDHELRLHASSFTPTDPTSIPRGGPAPVEGTPFDFRTPAPIGARWREGDEQLAFAGGYDHNVVLDGRDGGAPERDGLALAAVVTEPGSGRVLEVWTDQPGVQFYSGNHLTGQLRGKSGRLYRQGDAFCLETQHWPDSPNRPDFPSTVLPPQQTFRTSTVYRLTVG